MKVKECKLSENILYLAYRVSFYKMRLYKVEGNVLIIRVYIKMSLSRFVEIDMLHFPVTISEITFIFAS